MDINTKQRPVPSELLLDIKRLADMETDPEAILHDIFDVFDTETDSPLFGMMSPMASRKNKISRVTFNAAMRPIIETFVDSNPKYIYKVLSGYIHACMSGLRHHKSQDMITNPTLFRALMLLFPIVAERVSDRYDSQYSTENFSEFVAPLFSRLKRTDFGRFGTSYVSLYEYLRKSMRSGFSIAGTS
jgi:hypothetical protein